LSPTKGNKKCPRRPVAFFDDENHDCCGWSGAAKMNRKFAFLPKSPPAPQLAGIGWRRTLSFLHTVELWQFAKRR